MNKTSKIILILLLIIICFISFNKTYAIADTNFYEPPQVTSGYTEFVGKAGIVLGFVRNIGAVVSVLGIAALGLRYMVGSIDEKAKYKETMLPFILGIAILLTITTIATVIQNVATWRNGKTTYTEKDGKKYCDYCGDEIGLRENREGICDCGRELEVK